MKKTSPLFLAACLSLASIAHSQASGVETFEGIPNGTTVASGNVPLWYQFNGVDNAVNAVVTAGGGLNGGNGLQFRTYNTQVINVQNNGVGPYWNIGDGAADFQMNYFQHGDANTIVSVAKYGGWTGFGLDLGFGNIGVSAAGGDMFAPVYTNYAGGLVADTWYTIRIANFTLSETSSAVTGSLFIFETNTGNMLLNGVPITASGGSLSYSQINSIVVRRFGTTDDGAYSTIDNLSVTAAAVPEPSTLSLVGALGLFLVVRTLRRRAAAA